MDIRSSGLGSDLRDRAIADAKTLVPRRHNATISPRIMFGLSTCAASYVVPGGGPIRAAEFPPVGYISVRKFACSHGEQCAVPGCAERQTRDGGVVGSA